MNIAELLSVFKTPSFNELKSDLQTLSSPKIHIKGLVGSSSALLAAAISSSTEAPMLFILNEEEDAAYFFTDLENILGTDKVFFYGASKVASWQKESKDHANGLLRSEVLNTINKRKGNYCVVTFAEALIEKIITRQNLDKNTLDIYLNQEYSIDFINEFLIEYGFDHVDFVYEPGQFSIRGGIVDIFSFSDENPYRIEFFGNQVESIRSFDASTQLSLKNLVKISIIPDVNDAQWTETKCSFFDFIHPHTLVWIKDSNSIQDFIDKAFTAKEEAAAKATEKIEIEEYYENSEMLLKELLPFSIIEEGNKPIFTTTIRKEYEQTPQPLFKKNFKLLSDTLIENTKAGYKNIILSSNTKQMERLYSIFEDLNQEVFFSPVYTALHEGFIDKNLKIACYTDHQIFERYHRFKLKDGYQKSKQALSLKDLVTLQKGDYVAHINHGIGRFDGLEKLEINGKSQEAMRILYKENGILYVNIHSLHKVSKYSGKEGREIKVDRLGSKSWQTLKQNTKKRVKEVAFDLIKLYAERKTHKGFQFAPDNYLQTELEASFIYEDTPDQLKSTLDVKKDMESPAPMDRLVCGDVGFGKTEIAIRAAFKAVNDNKQVAILAPTTILALQHYKTFKSRLKDFPCTVDYINRFKSPAQQKETLQRLKEGKIDIIIGTHRLVSKDVVFKDIGLLIIDEEHKFGVTAKDRIKTIKTNIDTLTLTATPIPRTLQFSLMNARDLSIIATPPANRQPVTTELHTYNEEIIQEAIYKEIARDGQVFFIHNRVQNIHDFAGIIKRLCPEVSIAVGHGQMKPEELEDIILKFMDGEFDVLVSTTIVESGLDVPNANTMIIHDAHNFGLSDLHQMRGRVGRSNKKAYCYLLSPPLSTISNEARRRLKVIEQFSDLGSGFNIAMRDLDIRGAGDLLGGEQSGFISDMGYETYQKILDEAIYELKQNEFKEFFEEETNANKSFVEDCQIDTDLELLLPDYYINNVTERLSIYKELSDIEKEEDLKLFEDKLKDRFGPLPKQGYDLLDAIRLRWYGKKGGFEKIVLKSNTFIGYFVSNPKSVFYQSKTFAKVIQHIQENIKDASLKQKDDRLSVTIKGISSIHKASAMVNEMIEAVML